MKKTLVVMAAGMGSRFGGLKQIEPVGPNGEFIIDYSVYDAKKAGFEKVVFVIKHEIEQVFKETIGKRVEDKIEVSYAYQEIKDVPDKEYLVEQRNKPWGTVQAVLCAKDEVLGDFLVINADDFYGYDSFLKASQFLDLNLGEHTQGCITYPYIITASKFGAVKRGVCYTENDVITKIVESQVTLHDDHGSAVSLEEKEVFDIELDHPVAVNMFVFKHSFFKHLEDYFHDYFKQDDEAILKGESLLPNLVKDRILSGDIVLKNIVTQGRWIGITYRDDLDSLKETILEFIKNGDYPSQLWKD